MADEESDIYGGQYKRGHMSRAETLGHAAALMCRQFMEKGMPLEEITRMMLVAYIGMAKAQGMDLHRARRELFERWDEVRVQREDPKRIIEIS